MPVTKLTDTTIMTHILPGRGEEDHAARHPYGFVCEITASGNRTCASPKNEFGKQLYK